MTSVGRNMQCSYTGDAEGILTFQKHVACEMANN
jgi:hypothetical protein